MTKALLVIDVQYEYFSGKLPVSYPENSFANILAVMDAATENKIEVIVIQHTSRGENAPTFRKGSPEWELHSEVANRPYDKLIEKNFPGSFTNTELQTYLQEKNIDTLVISGYMTQMCCDTTSRQAFHAGYKVEFLADATGTLAIANGAGSVSAEELHRSILVTQQMVFSQVLTTDDWIKGLTK